MPSGGSKAGPLVVILGATASGKTGLSLNLAEACGCEIVSADSRLVYRGMDIGTAKPSAEEQARVPHHLLDIVSPAQTLSLSEYQRLAYHAIHDILSRCKYPLLVGGTGQYITAVIEGWRIPEIKPNPALRAELEAFARARGSEALWKRLATVDKAAAATIHANNVRRVIRALEVYLESGMPISVLQEKTPPPYHILQIGLDWPRDALHERIDARITQMLADGLLDEVRALVGQGYDHHCPAMSGLGYRQLIAYLEGETEFDAAVEAIRRETRDFARRQIVWFNKYNQQAHWFDMTRTTTATIIEFVRGWLERNPNAAS